MQLPPDVVVLDLSKGGEPPPYRYAIGRYDERRPGIYTSALFGGVRDWHVGIDFLGPVGTELYAFADGEILMRAYNAAPGDYGYTLVTRHAWHGRELFALYGHLAPRSILENPIGKRFREGEVIAWVGDRHENGGWPPHLHFQLSWQRPETCDMPGVVAASEREKALQLYPDPRLFLPPFPDGPTGSHAK
jgi:murein DD-endopeptidase MepM/ murein hydrolase activator NlpD